MRLLTSFVVLLLVAATANTMVWQNLLAARVGEATARVVVFISAPLAFAAVVLLAHIVLRVYALRRRVAEQLRHETASRHQRATENVLP